ncbi:MAG: helix-turn-helix domain-containing protein [Acidimicrobiales bacterium]|jgi:excisionase family DNA binding protein|nr:helix-turn-helix domain-containing protein [Acidimicrobiales bacterium]
MPPERLWTIADVAGHLGVSERTVRTWQRKYGLPHLRIGGTIRFRPEEIRAWVDRHEAHPTAGAELSQLARRNAS